MDRDPPARFLEQLPIGVRQQENWLLRVIDRGVGEIGLVVGDEEDGVLAGDVAGSDDGDVVPGDAVAEFDAANRAA